MQNMKYQRVNNHTGDSSSRVQSLLVKSPLLGLNLTSCTFCEVTLREIRFNPCKVTLHEVTLREVTWCKATLHKSHLA